MPSAHDTELKHCADAIRRGELVAFPTETVYGLGANATDPIAVAKIFAAKQRPFFDPLIVHVSSLQMAEQIGQINSDVFRKIAKAFWPGPLTIIVKKHRLIPDIVTSGLDTVGIRMPKNELAHELITMAKVPIAAPSANTFGQLSPTTMQHVVEDLGDKVRHVLDGGACSVGIESTIVDISEDDIKIRRLGAISPTDIQNALPEYAVETTGGVIDDSMPLAPGELADHYAPKAQLELVPYGDWQKWDELNQEGDFGILLFDKSKMNADYMNDKTIFLSDNGDLLQAAARLFSALHNLDSKFSRIVAELVPNEGIGMAINDRLRRASSKT